MHRLSALHWANPERYMQIAAPLQCKRNIL
jgi:hypothetical protein